MTNLTFVSFSGHRDRTVPVSELDRIAAEFPGAVWVHGGAIGFDWQVSSHAGRRGIRQVVIPPRYFAPGDATAPLIRNCVIVNASPVLVVAWDGRRSGGTFRTMQFAESLDKTIIRLELKSQ